MQKLIPLSLGIVRDWAFSFINLFFPRCCVVCGSPLGKGEVCLCLRCNLRMPRTNFHRMPENPLERLFWGKIPVVRATAFFFYRKGSPYCEIVHELKYKGRKEMGLAMGRCLASEIASSGFFEEIDLIVPIPLHKKKLRKRGYNQSESLARGLSEITGIPVDTHAVARIKNTPTQTRKSVAERMENMRDVFHVDNPEAYTDKHLLLVDDVLTTGATLSSCAEAFGQQDKVRFSVIALAAAAM